jgi:hypothetical protein
MSWVFQFVDHRDGIILHRNRAVTGGINQELIVSVPVVQGFAFVFRFDPLFTERHTTPYEVRAILRHFDLRAVVFFFIVSSSFCGQYPTVKR